MRSTYELVGLVVFVLKQAGDKFVDGYSWSVLSLLLLLDVAVVYRPVIRIVFGRRGGRQRFLLSQQISYKRKEMDHMHISSGASRNPERAIEWSYNQLVNLQKKKLLKPFQMSAKTVNRVYFRKHTGWL